MCRKVTCPNDGKATWWGCGNHIETALAGVAPEDRCDCPHVPVDGNPNMFEVKPNEDKQQEMMQDQSGGCRVM